MRRERACANRPHVRGSRAFQWREGLPGMPAYRRYPARILDTLRATWEKLDTVQRRRADHARVCAAARAAPGPALDGAEGEARVPHSREILPRIGLWLPTDAEPDRTLLTCRARGVPYPAVLLY